MACWSLKWLSVCILLTSLALVSAEADEHLEFNMDDFAVPGFGKKQADKAPSNKADIPFIQCQVCESIVKQSIKAVKALKADLKPGQKLSEADIVEQLESMCDPDLEAGDWINYQHLQQEGDKLKLVDMGQMGQCGTPCRTVAKSCSLITDAADLSDFSELLYKGSKRAALTNWLCHEETRVCRKKVPPVPADRPEAPFKALSDKEVQQKQLSRNMKKAGLSGTMYDRESMASALDGMKGSGMDLPDLDGGEGAGSGREEL